MGPHHLIEETRILLHLTMSRQTCTFLPHTISPWAARVRSRTAILSGSSVCSFCRMARSLSSILKKKNDKNSLLTLGILGLCVNRYIFAGYGGLAQRCSHVHAESPTYRTGLA